MPFWKHKPAKRTDRTRLVERAKRWWSKAILKEQPICQKCRRKPAVHAHHVITRGARGAKAWWFSMSYGCGLCFDCHSSWAHSTDYERQKAFTEDFLKPWLAKRGLDYDRLLTAARARCGKLQNWDIEVLIDGLKKYVKQ